MKEINGKRYPMWEQFVEKKKEWIGGTLEDSGDSIDQTLFGGLKARTEIVDIVLKENGKESAWFEVVGKDFSCGGDVGHLGIIDIKEPWLGFHGYGWTFVENT